MIQVAAAPTATNTAKCIKTTGLSGTCTINQSSTSANNVAIVLQVAAKMSGLTQTATYSAQITQRTTAAGAFNRACVLQLVNIDASTVARRGTPVNVNLAAHQTANITQDSATGDNTVQAATTSPTGACDAAGSPLKQTQILTSTATGGGPITQNQNSVDTGPNIALNIKQNKSAGFVGTATGKNVANFEQSNTLSAIANTPVGGVNQTQSSANGGILATVNQDSRGLSTANATQTERQCEDAHTTAETTCHTATPDPPGYSLTQTQFGPMRKGAGDSVQTGNENCVPSCNIFTVTQTSFQDNDTQDPDTQTNLIQGDCATTGNCTVTQTTNVNGTPPHTNTQSGQNVDTQTTCSGSTCTSGGPTTTGDLTLLPDGLSVANSDVGEFGYGGMRSSGIGTITVTGVSAPVFHAFLYWNGPTNSSDPDSNASVTFDGTPITGTNIGTASDNNWNYLNGQSYRADVTALVAGSGTYDLSDFIKTDESENIVSDINGAALIVFYDDGNSSNDRNVTLWNGNDSNVTLGPPYLTDGWNETISNVSYPGSGSASLDLVVSDGQFVFDDAALVVNGTTVEPAGAIFSGQSTPANEDQSAVNGGSLWDIEPFDITSLLSSGSNNIQVTTGVNQDFLSLVVAIANVPASAPIILTSPTASAARSAGNAVRPTAAGATRSAVAGGGAHSAR